MNGESFISRIVELRWLVGSLGESAAIPWWRSKASSDAGIRYLERLYPRTYLVASLEAASRAAGLVHDASLARTGHHHLFRLPAADEVAIREWLREPEGVALLRRLAALSDEQRLEDLQRWAGSESAPDAQGPLNCGPVDGLSQQSTLARICAGYFAGFRAGRPVYPYLEAGPS